MKNERNVCLWSVVLSLLMLGSGYASLQMPDTPHILISQQPEGTSGAVNWYKMGEDNTLETVTTNPFWGGAMKSVIWGDFDNDEKIDIFVADGSDAVRWYEVTDLGTGSVTQIGGAFRTGGLPMAIGDYKGDGEIWLFIAWAGNIVYYKNGGDNVIVGPSTTLTSSGAQCTAIGNLDHYLGIDLLVGRNNRLSWYEWDPWTNSNILLGQYNNFDVRAVVLGDFDGDMDADVLFINSYGANDGAIVWLEFRSDGMGTVWNYVRSIGLDEEENTGFVNLALGDVTGNGRNELVAVHESGAIRVFTARGDNVADEIAHPLNDITDATGGIAIIPPARPCNDGGLLMIDLNGDCVVDIGDLVVLADNWLNEKPGGFTGIFPGDPTGNGFVDLVDFERVARGWLTCTDGEDTNCFALP